MKSIVAIISLLALSLSGESLAHDRVRAQCIRVIDGDTVEVLTETRSKLYEREIIRLFGVNTPELRSKNKAEKLKARKASQWVAEQLDCPWARISNPTVKLDKWPLEINRYGKGKYGRVLADIFVGAVHINQELLRRGMAKPM